jgi:hypothetical protein
MTRETKENPANPDERADQVFKSLVVCGFLVTTFPQHWIAPTHTVRSTHNTEALYSTENHAEGANTASTKQEARTLQKATPKGVTPSMQHFLANGAPCMSTQRVFIQTLPFMKKRERNVLVPHKLATKFETPVSLMEKTLRHTGALMSSTR